MKGRDESMMNERRILPFVIMIIFIAGTVLGAAAVNVSAAALTGGEKGTSEVTYLGNSKDGKGWKNPHTSTGKQFKYTVKVKNEKKVGYCIEPGKSFLSNHSYEATLTSKAKAWTKLSEARRRVLALVLYYGYNTGKSVPYGNANDYYAATQVLVWEAVDGNVTLSSAGKWSKTSNAHDNLISDRTYAEKNYKWIKEKITEHVKGASFTTSASGSAKTYIMNYNYKTKKWSRTLKDSDEGNYLKRHKDTADSLSMSRSGYSYTFETSSEGSKNAVLVNDKSSGTSQAMLVLKASKSTDQALIFGATDSTLFHVKVRTEEQGTGKITKTSDDGNVAGFNFQVTCAENGYSKVHTTNEKGIITASLYPGTYTVTEVLTEEQKKEGYIAPAAQKMVVEENKTTTVKMHNKKIPEGTNVYIKKENRDGSSPEGFRFVIINDETGEKKECVTGPDGTADVSDLTTGAYTVTEVLNDDQKLRFKEPQSQKVQLGEDGATAVVYFENLTKETPLKIKKTCIDGKVAGIEFKVTGTLAWGDNYGPEVFRTDENGNIDCGQLQPGTYIIEEINPDESRYTAEEPQTITITGDEKEPLEVEFENHLTSLYLTKIDGSTGEFLPGALFALLNEDGSELLRFEINKEDDVVKLNPVMEGEQSATILVYADTDKSEFGCLRGLAVGTTYILKEVTAPEGYAPAADLEFVFKNGLELRVENEKPEIVTPAPEEPSTFEPVEETKPVSEAIPEKAVVTGDEDNVLLPLGLVLIAIAVMSILLFRRENEQ